jgi:hypothetical protein
LLLSDSHSSLGDVPALVAGLDVSSADETELTAVLAQVRAAQRCLEGLTIRIGVRSNELAALGRAAPAAETLRGDGAIGAAQARREARRSDAAQQYPVVGQAVRSGEMSGEHVDAIARHTTGLTTDEQAAFNVDAAVEQAKRLPPETFNRHLKRTIDAIRGDNGHQDAAAKHQQSEFHHWFDHDTGMGRFAGSLNPERYETLIAVIEQRVASLAAAGDVEKGPNLAAQALVELVAGSGRNGQARNRLPSIVVVVDHETAASGPHPGTVCQTENGHDISATSVARLACDATMRSVTLGRHGLPVNVGRKHRTATDAQWTALKSMYSSCAWYGCPAPISWCQAHHIHEWERGGPTDLNNLIPLCSQHHHRVHEGQWSIKLKPDRSLAIHRPDGSLHRTVPPPNRAHAGAMAVVP